MPHAGARARELAPGTLAPPTPRTKPERRLLHLKGHLYRVHAQSSSRNRPATDGKAASLPRRLADQRPRDASSRRTRSLCSRSRCSRHTPLTPLTPLTLAPLTLTLALLTPTPLAPLTLTSLPLTLALLTPTPLTPLTLTSLPLTLALLTLTLTLTPFALTRPRRCGSRSRRSRSPCSRQRRSRRSRVRPR